MAEHGPYDLRPDVRAHRIAVDSGAYATGILTAVVLKDDRLRFVAATDNGSMAPAAQQVSQGHHPRPVGAGMQDAPVRLGHIELDDCSETIQAAG